MAIVVAPNFVVGNDFEPGNKHPEPTVAEENVRFRLAIALEVAALEMRDDEETTRREQRGMA